LTVEIVERHTGRLVYRVEANSPIGSNLAKYVTKAVDRAFTKFP